MISEEKKLDSSSDWWVLAVGLILSAIGAGLTIEAYIRNNEIDGLYIHEFKQNALVFRWGRMSNYYFWVYQLYIL